MLRPHPTLCSLYLRGMARSACERCRWLASCLGIELIGENFPVAGTLLKKLQLSSREKYSLDIITTWPMHSPKMVSVLMFKLTRERRGFML